MRTTITARAASSTGARSRSRGGSGFTSSLQTIESVDGFRDSMTSYANSTDDHGNGGGASSPSSNSTSRRQSAQEEQEEKKMDDDSPNRHRSQDIMTSLAEYRMDDADISVEEESIELIPEGQILINGRNGGTKDQVPQRLLSDISKDTRRAHNLSAQKPGNNHDESTMLDAANDDNDDDLSLNDVGRDPLRGSMIEISHDRRAVRIRFICVTSSEIGAAQMLMSALDMGFSSKTLQAHWMKEDDDDNESSSSDDDSTDDRCDALDSSGKIPGAVIRCTLSKDLRDRISSLGMGCSAKDLQADAERDEGSISSSHADEGAIIVIARDDLQNSLSRDKDRVDDVQMGTVNNIDNKQNDLDISGSSRRSGRSILYKSRDRRVRRSGLSQRKVSFKHKVSNGGNERTMHKKISDSTISTDETRTNRASNVSAVSLRASDLSSLSGVTALEKSVLDEQRKPTNEESFELSSLTIGTGSTGHITNADESNVRQDRIRSCPDISSGSVARRRGADLRRSTLVAPNSSIDPSWFASRGLMSQKSFKIYKKEMKKSLLQQVPEASKAGNKSSHRRYHQRSMSDSSISIDQLQTSERSGFSTSYATALEYEDVVDERVSKELRRPKLNPRKPPARSASMPTDAGLHYMLDSFVGSLKECECNVQKNTAFGALLGEMLSLPTIRESVNLSTDEAALLGKLMRRLSTQEVDDSDDGFFAHDEALNRAPLEDETQTMLRVNSKSNKGPSKTGTTPNHNAKNAAQADESLQENTKKIGNHVNFLGSTERKGSELLAICVSAESKTRAQQIKSMEDTSLDFHNITSSPRPLDTPSSQANTNETAKAHSNANSVVRIDERGAESGSPNLEPKTTPLTGSDYNIIESVSSENEACMEEMKECEEGTLQALAGDARNNIPKVSMATGAACELAKKVVANDPHLPTDPCIKDSAAMDREDDTYDSQRNCLDISGHTNRAVCGENEPRAFRRSNRRRVIPASVCCDDAKAKSKPRKYPDFLSEGLNHLSMVTLVNLYGKLRELSFLGHISVKLVDIDVNSHQSIAREKEMRRRMGLLLKPEKEDAIESSRVYTEHTRTSRFVVQAVLDEYEMFEMSNELYSLNQAQKASMAYDASLLQDLKTWVEDSKVDDGNGNYGSFCKGSILVNLKQTGLEVVWFSDRHPSDITYCICVQRETATVTVIFHAQESVTARLRNTAMMEYPNPIAHERGMAAFINLRSVISEEILRKRRDTGKTTIEEIRDKVEKIGKEIAGDSGYNLSVTGHSKAGGLATVLGYYLAADPRLELASAVRVFSFASSQVGCRGFQHGFRHLEDTGRIMLARFTNVNEVVFLPFSDLNGSWEYDNLYKHVGMQIHLYANTAQAFDISYDKEPGLLMQLFYMIKELFCFNWKKSHITEYHQRIHSSRQYSLTHSSSSVYAKGSRAKKGARLPSLDELYSIGGRYNTSGEGNAKKSYPVYIYISVSFFVLLELVLFLRMANKI